MQILKQWRGHGSKKRAAEESIEDSSRKRTKDDFGRRESIEEEYGIRGRSTKDKGKDSSQSTSPSPNQLARSPIATDPLPSTSSTIHPDRLGNFINVTPTSPPPTSLQKKRDSPLSPLSQSPERINTVESEEPRRKLFFSIGEIFQRVCMPSL